MHPVGELYDVYLLFSSGKVRPLWHWDIWIGIIPAIDPIIDAAGKSNGIRTSQEASSGSAIKFGRMDWSIKSNQRWTHYSPVDIEGKNQSTFVSAEVWAPKWNECEIRGINPHFFLAIINDEEEQAPVVTIALAERIATENQAAVYTLVEQMHDAIDSKLTIVQKRIWEGHEDEMGYRNSIQDECFIGCDRKHESFIRKDSQLDLSSFEHSWEYWR